MVEIKINSAMNSSFSPPNVIASAVRQSYKKKQSNQVIFTGLNFLGIDAKALVSLGKSLAWKGRAPS